MGEVDANGGDSYVYLSIVVLVISNCISQVFNDGFLKEFYFKVLLACFGLLLISMLSILSKACDQERTARNPVWDSESRNVKDRENQPKTKFFRLIKSVRIYELMYMAGIFFIISAILLEVFSLVNDPSMKPGFDAAALVLIGSGLYLMILIYIAAEYRKPKSPIKYAYQPFNEFIRVPMHIFVPKMFLHLSSNFLSLAAIIFYEFCAIVALVKVERMTEGEIKKFVEATEFAEIHKAMITGMTLANISGILLIIGRLVAASNSVKMDLLLTFEQNWKWNMAALTFLFQYEEFESLEELRDAFLEKSQQEDLTEAEKKAIMYIERPLWKSKLPFIRNRELSKIPEALQSTQPEDAQPSTSRSTQGPQPEQPQPSSSTQRPLRVG